MKNYLVTVIMLFVFSVNAFDMDVSLGEMKRLNGEKIIGDLSIGEIGNIEPRAFCFKNKKLYVSPQGRILGKSNKLYNISITINPNNKAKITIKPHNKDIAYIASHTLIIKALTSITRRFHCSLWDNDVTGRELIEIISINNKNKSSDLIKY